MSETQPEYKFQSIPIHVTMTHDMMIDVIRSWKYHILVAGEQPGEQGDLSLGDWIVALQNQFHEILKGQLAATVERIMGDVYPSENV